MATVPGIRLVRRLEPLAEYSPPAVITLYELDHPEVCQSRDYQQMLQETGAWRYFHHLTQSVGKVYEQIFARLGHGVVRRT